MSVFLFLCLLKLIQMEGKMKKHIISEILLTNDNVCTEAWLSLLNTISKLNGLFRPWHIYAKIELNQVRFFVETSQILPPIINSLGDFMIKRLDITDEDLIDFNYSNSRPLFITNKEKNLLDVYDKVETKKNKVLKLVKMSVLSYRKDHFFTRTYLFFEKPNKKVICKKAFLVIPHYFFSIDFSIYNRFFYMKNFNEYLDIQKSIPLFSTEKNNSLLEVDTFPYLAEEYYLSQNSFDFDKHSIIIGSSGTGKSKLASLLISNISSSKNYKVVIIDPHAALEKEIGGLDNTKIIDFKSLENSSDLFINNSKKDIMQSIELVLSLFQTLIADQYNSKLERVLRHSIYLLMEASCLDFSNLKNLILDMDFRNNLIKKLQGKVPDSITNFFLTDFNDLRANSYQEAIAPIISFIDEMELVPVFKNDGNKLQLRNIIEENFLTIFSLDQTILGQKVTKTISGLVMQQILELIQSYTYNEHIILVIDEVSLIENPILARFLSEARKYNLSLILIQQYFNQISDNLRNAIFANVENFYVFRVSKSDAITLESNMHMNVAVRNSYKVKLKLLTELKNRECIVRISSNGTELPAFKAKTIDFEPVPRKHTNQILRTNPLVSKTLPYAQNKPAEPSLTSFYSEKHSDASIIDASQNSFSIGDSIGSAFDLMHSLSTGRMKLEEKKT